MDAEASVTSGPLPEDVAEYRQDAAQQIGVVPSYGIVADTGPPAHPDRPSLIKHVSNPAYDSPLRHHRRNHSTPREVKESLNARSEYITSDHDGVAQHRINQYIIKQEIGRGSFGAVHLAVDQYKTEYAVKEFSKSRLRKRAQSHVLRQPRGIRKPGQLAAKQGFNSPLHRNPSGDLDGDGKGGSAIELIKEEIAIMKKLDHPNLVSLVEVLDDPTEDSLYMVMEMCKKGVIMHVGLGERADPYKNEACRCWFRDLILGIEYLHAQGVVHRDIKPDNCLLTNDDVLKIVDFGVSEMFEKDSEMLTAKSAGSPAFLPPELCVARHGDVSGKAADIWSMGVTLYCLKYGRIPFEKTGIFELYDSIRSDEPEVSQEDKDFHDLMFRILEKDPQKRIRMKDLRAHPWVTKGGSDPLLSEEENTANLVEPPTEEEMNMAITGNMGNVMTVVKAVQKFKSLTGNDRPPQMSTILGDEDQQRFFKPPMAMTKAATQRPAHTAHSVDADNRRPLEGALASEGLHRDVDLQNLRNSHFAPDSRLTGNDGSADQQQPGRQNLPNLPNISQEPSISSFDVQSKGSSDSETDYEYGKFPPFRSSVPRTVDDSKRRGQAHDPLEDTLYLYIGPSTYSGLSATGDNRTDFMSSEDDVFFVSESPGAADVDIYETAYRDEIEKIKARTAAEGKEPVVYLNRRVDAKLMAISGKAGRWLALSEEGFNKARHRSGFNEGKARVTGVSRALREVAKQEYVKRKQERQEMLEAASRTPLALQREKSDLSSGALTPSSTVVESPTAEQLDDFEKPRLRASRFSSSRAHEKGSQAKSSFKGLVGAMKDRAKTSREGTHFPK